MITVTFDDLGAKAHGKTLMPLLGLYFSCVETQGLHLDKKKKGGKNLHIIPSSFLFQHCKEKNMRNSFLLLLVKFKNLLWQISVKLHFHWIHPK